MIKVAVTYSPEVGGSSVLSLKKSFSDVGCEVCDADYREVMRAVPKKEFAAAYKTLEGRKKLFAHAKAAAAAMLTDMDCLAISGNSAMIDPTLFYKKRSETEHYDFGRTLAELALIHVATQKGMPIMGVCGGHQAIAVYGGGSIKSLNAQQLAQQHFMNYDEIIFNTESTLAQIVREKPYSNTPLRQEFFGAHTQVVKRLGRGFKRTASSSDEESIEAAETESGAPIISTQFHPEISANSLHDLFIYDKGEAEKEASLKLFIFFHDAAETYHNKRNAQGELKSKNQHNDDSIKPSIVKGSGIKFSQLRAFAKKKAKDKSTNWHNGLIGMAIFGAIAATALILIFPSVSVAVLAIAGLSVGVTAAASLGFVVGAVVGILLIGIAKATTFALGNIKLLLGKFLRNLLSVIYTNEQIDKLQKAESNTQPEFFEGNSSKDILKYMGEDGQLPNNVVDAKESLDTKPTARRHSSPAEIMTDEPATPWNSNTP